jgi:uncharacterized RDD family membrane protein YckC
MVIPVPDPGSFPVAAVPAPGPIASLGRRLTAFLVDLAVVGPALLLLSWAWVRLFEVEVPAGNLPLYEILVQLYAQEDPLVLGGALVLSLLAGLYFFVGHLLLGGSPGMRLLGLAIVDEEGASPGVGVAAARVATSLLSGAYFLLGFVWIAFDGGRQGLHDKVAQTWVIRKPNLTTSTSPDTQVQGH